MTGPLAPVVDAPATTLPTSTRRARYLSPTHVDRSLSLIDPTRVVLAFISGYVLATPDAPSVSAAAAAAKWCHTHSVPVVLDLVPHEFAESVGGLDVVDRVLGPTTVLVGELRTARGLGLCDPYETSSEASNAMSQAAIALMNRAKVGVVQHRLDERTYGQAIGIAGDVMMTNYRLDGSTDFLGLGDRMLVDALTAVGFTADRST